MKQLARSAAALLLIAALLLSPQPARAAEEGENAFTSQLSPLSRMFYDDMLSPEGLRKLRSGESFEYVFDVPYENPPELDKTYREAFGYAAYALLLTHPRLFWLANGFYAGVWEADGRTALRAGVAIYSDWETGGRSIDEDEAALNAVVSQLAAEARTRGGAYEQLVYVHDWLTTHNEYNRANLDAFLASCHLPWTAMSALTDAEKPVCEGYARAFQLVCDELGIPCVLVWGTLRRSGHAWNQVYLDGQWYAVDVTGDDPLGGAVGNVSGCESHSYFLVGGDTVIYGSAFSSTHVPDDPLPDGVDLSFPPLAAEAYDPRAPRTAPAPAPAPHPGLANFQKVNAYAAGIFPDVSAAAWYAENVQTAYELGLMVGSDGGFNPMGNLTVAEALVLACRLHSCYYGGGAVFTQGSPWYQVYVDYAVENGIIPPGKYDYRAAATRLEFAEILCAALPAEALQVINNVPDGAIPDVAASGAVYRLYRAGVLTGSDEYGSFEPNSSIQRCAAAAIVTRMASPALRKTVKLKPRAGVFDYLVSRVSGDGAWIEDGYTLFFQRDRSVSAALIYSPEDDALSISYVREHDDGYTSGCHLTMDRAMTGPFEASFTGFLDWDDDFSIAFVSIDPAGFSFDPAYVVTFDDVWDIPGSMLPECQRMFTADLRDALEGLQASLLDPVSLSLRDLGFARYEG